MAAKKNDPRREARIAKNNRNLNSALTLFTAGFIAEFYLLLINQYFVKGSVDQVVAIAGYLEVMAIVGAAAFGAGVVLTVMRRKWTRFAAAGKWLLGLGLFFGVSSLLMRRVYPMGTTVMCILVPVLMLLAVVFLLYQHEFAVQTIALTLAIAMSAKYLRQVRATVLDELSKDYVLGARARGVKFSTTMIKSVMKASLVTIITLLTLSIGSLLGGTAIASLFTTRSAVSFLVFTLLYTPCVAAVATIRRELNSTLKTALVVLMQCAVAWVVAFAAYTLGGLL